MRVALIIPMKSPSRAKQRLEGILSEPERLRLAQTMAVDVLDVVARVPEIRPYAVSDDPALRALAERHGITAIIDRERAGQSAAVRQGFQAAAASGSGPVATIPGDVPAVTVAEVLRLCQERPEIDVLLATDRDGVGTNGLRLPSPDAIGLHFGEDSLRQHRDEASRAELTFAMLLLERLACDLDRPEDLAAFLRLAPPTRTLALLQELQVQDRLAAGDRPRG